MSNLGPLNCLEKIRICWENFQKFCSRKNVRTFDSIKIFELGKKMPATDAKNRKFCGTAMGRFFFEMYIFQKFPLGLRIPLISGTLFRKQSMFLNRPKVGRPKKSNFFTDNNIVFLRIFCYYLEIIKCLRSTTQVAWRRSPNARHKKYVR